MLGIRSPALNRFGHQCIIIRSMNSKRLSTCSAIIQNSFGGSDVLEYTTSYKVASPKKKQVLVEIYGSSVNPLDCQQRTGSGKRLFEMMTREKNDFPICPGCEFAGKIIDVGTDSKFRVGERVWGFAPAGKSWAEKICIDDGCITLAPEKIPLHVAGTFPKVAVTVAAVVKGTGVKDGNFSGKRVFINGGSGGVGTFFTQLLKENGAKEIAVTCSEKNVDLCRELGADTVIDYRKDDFSEILADFDFYVDGVNMTDEDRKVGYKVLRKGGRYLTLNLPWIGNTDISGVLRGTMQFISWLWAMKSHARRTNGIKFSPVVGMPDMKFLENTAKLVDSGKIRPIIDSVYRLDQMKEAHDLVDSGRTRGKVNIVIKEDVQ